MQSNVPTNLTRNQNLPPQRSQFNRSSNYKTTFDAGFLIPIYVDEVLPGDTFNMKATCFARMATPIFPIMDNLFFDTHWFFCPNRLLHANFKKMMGEVPVQGADNPNNYTSPIMDNTTYPALGFAEQSIPDYFGLPTLVTLASIGGIMNIPINALPFRMYNFIYNEWFIDQSLQTPVYFSDDDLDLDDFADYTLLRRGKRKDYFTSASLYPQKLWSGDLAPTVPYNPNYALLQPVSLDPTASSYNPWNIRIASTKALETTSQNLGVQVTTGDLTNGGGAADYVLDPNTSLVAEVDASQIMGTINELRIAVQMQRFLEKDNRGGTRYPELVWNHFHVISPDMAWRPEYLGGSSNRVNITPVQQTSESGTTPQGNLAAQATLLSQPRWVKTFTEHGFIMGIASVRADMNYQQNIERMWFTRRTRYDFFWPTFAHLPEQPVYTLELYAGATTWIATYNVFGYQERYAEYKYKTSLITGQFRSNSPTTLDAWHLAQEFGAEPTLGANFIVENPPVNRVVAVPSEPQFIMDCYFDLKCARAMPTYSIPGMMDHF